MRRSPNYSPTPSPSGVMVTRGIVILGSINRLGRPSEISAGSASFETVPISNLLCRVSEGSLKALISLGLAHHVPYLFQVMN